MRDLLNKAPKAIASDDDDQVHFEVYPEGIFYTGQNTTD